MDLFEDDEINIRRKLFLLQLLAISAVMISEQSEKTARRKAQRKRRWWIRPLNRRRVDQGDYNNLYVEMRTGDIESFFNYTRMSVEMFDQLLHLVGPHLQKRSNRPSISPTCRLLITLRLLAAGDCLQSVAFAFRVGKSTVCEILKETCEVLWKILQPLYIPTPDEQHWTIIAEGFLNRWQLPNCVGAIDGKHIHIKQPTKSGSLYFNYKKTFSIVLFAVCDSKYRFSVVDIGAYGSQSDGGILRESEFGKALMRGTLNLPENRVLPHTNIAFPHFFVGDNAFPLHLNLLKPYGGSFLSENLRIFNYRLSRARRCIENAFGILAARWRVFHKTIHALPETADKIVKATTCLHNFIMSKQEELQDNRYCNDNFIDREVDNLEINGGWRQEVPSENAIEEIRGRRLGSRNAKLCAVDNRNIMKDYLNNQGNVEWQREYVNAM